MGRGQLHFNYLGNHQKHDFEFLNKASKTIKETEQKQIISWFHLFSREESCCGAEARLRWVSRKLITKLAPNCQLSLARLSPTRVFLQLNPDSPGSWWQPYLWPRHLTPLGSELFYFPNKILKFNPGYHSLTIVYCAQQMTLNSPESPLARRVNGDWFKNYDEDCQTALRLFGHKQWSSDNPGHGDGDLTAKLTVER